MQDKAFHCTIGIHLFQECPIIGLDLTKKEAHYMICVSSWFNNMQNRPPTNLPQILSNRTNVSQTQLR